MRNKILLYCGMPVGLASADAFPSMALMALSAYVKQKGFEAELLLNRHSDEEIAKMLANTLAVGFSVYTGNGIDHSLRMAKKIRAMDPAITLIWGGYHPSLEPDRTLLNPYVDYVVRGEGEETLTELLMFLQKRGPDSADKITGLSHKAGGRIIHNPGRAPLKMDELPPYDYDLYAHSIRKNRPNEGVEYISSRGCPFNCKFCANAAFTREQGGYRTFSNDRIVSDIQRIVTDYQPGKIYIWDDTFFFKKERLAYFLEEYKKRNFTFKWFVQARADFIAAADDNLLKQLKETNIKRVLLGIESGSPRMLERIRKRIKVEDVITAAEKLAKHDIIADYDFVNGFPNETLEDVHMSVQLRNRLKRISPASTVRFHSYTPYPKTETMEECVTLGYKLPATLEEWGLYEIHSFKQTWLSRKHSRIVNLIAWAAHFDAFPYFQNVPVLKQLFNFIRWDGRMRLKHEAFTWAPEFWLVNTVYRQMISRFKS